MTSRRAWWQDGAAHFGPEVEVLQVMYYPQATPKAAGPTEVRRTPLLRV